MAQTIHLTLSIDGTQVKGESSQVQEGKEGTIEVFSFESSVTTPTDPGSGKATGRREFHPVKIKKRIDASTPLIAEAMVQGTPCTCRFDFYRPSATPGVADELFYHIELVRATVAGLSQYLPDVMSAHSQETRDAYEVVEFTFDQITWFTELPSGKGCTDSWSGKK